MSSSRRRFVAAAGAAAWSARSYAQIRGADDLLRIGVIGCGGMAGVHVQILVRNKEKDNAELITACDLFQKRLDKAAGLTGGKKEKDYRAVLENKDVDYVLVATPEHWRYRVASDALDAGKHVYVEKPMRRKIDEAKRLFAKVQSKPKQKLQDGVQGMSDESCEAAYEYVKSGALGKVVLCQIDYSRNRRVDWKTWLGSAPERDWDPDRFFRWRRYWDYSGGVASDLYVHRATRLIKALGLKFPEYVVATGGKFEFAGSKAEIPDTFNALADYPGGPTMQLISTMANDAPVEHLLRGHKATPIFTRSGFTITPQRDFAGEAKPFTYQKQGAESVDPHHRDLQNAIRKNEPLRCDGELGLWGGGVCEMAVVSRRRRAYLRWDARKQRAVKA